MTDALWPRVRALFDEALELSGAERAAFLERAGVEPEVRAEVERMLRSDGSAASGFLETSSSVLESALLPPIGTRIGRYALKRVIASGGMGTVFEAVQDEPHRSVAVKTMRFGLASPERLQRFRFEAEVLGHLRHPSIAQVFEAGTHEEAGEQVPFIAMELVPGARDILSYAREEELELPERLALFLEVCEAVQHGHQKGVIHRDLKPGNILVDAEGRAKVIDFGVARATAGASPFGGVATHTGQILGTLAYMAPEQLAGSPDAVDVRSDVYALGILLFELVEGRPPHDLAGKSPAAALRIIQEERLRPSVATQRELGWILERALAKEPERRYGSVTELAADLRRYLLGEPVLAGPPSVAYRLSKWIQRNPARSAAAAIGASAFVVISVLLITTVKTSETLGRERINLVGANEALEKTNTALEAKTVESEHRRVTAEQSAEREKTRFDEFVRLSALQELDDLVAEADRLWPAIPESLPRYRVWLEKARELVAELPDHERKLAELRTRSLPWTVEEQAQQRAEHPRLKELQTAERHREHLANLRAALDAGEPARDPKAEEVGVDLAKLPATADYLNWLAWPLIDPDRKDWGGEAKGLVLSRRAVELAAALAPAERAYIRDSLAWALFANGRFDEAVAEEERALEEAAEDKKLEFEANLSKLEKRIGEEIDPDQEDEREKRMAEITELIATLEAEVGKRHEWRFADAQDGWWHDQLEKLGTGLKVFSAPETGLAGSGTSPEHGWSVAKRAEFAGTIAERSVRGSEAAARWSEATASIADVEDCPPYAGLGIAPQLGLLPIGRDPETGLWEFAHLQTGEPAKRGPDGKLVLEEATGLVFVLLPGGTFTMGAQRSDPAGPNYDPQARPEEGPLQEVTLSPFFLSKYEMTQGQWLRFVGRNPSLNNSNLAGWRADLVHPVESVSWAGCAEVLGRLGLELPSEAQWEYGARAGTTTVWWTGNDKQTLSEAGNVSDSYAKVHGGHFWPSHELDIDDGYTEHARVGSDRANSFGLHGVIGNVWEWCEDGYQSDFFGQPSKRYRVPDPAGSSLRVDRGGSYSMVASFARSAYRNLDPPSHFASNLGVRPGRRVRP